MVKFALHVHLFIHSIRDNSKIAFRAIKQAKKHCDYIHTYLNIIKH